MDSLTARPESGPGDDGGHVMRGQRPRWGAVALVGVLGSGGVVAELLGHGPDGVQAAVLLVGLTIGLVAAVHLPGLGFRDRCIAAVCVSSAAALLVVPLVGRAPLLLVAAGTAVADLAMFGVPPRAGVRWRPVAPALVVLAAGDVMWVLRGSNLLAAVLLLAALGLVALRRPASEPSTERRPPRSRRVSERGRRAAAGARRRATLAVAGLSRAARRVARIATSWIATALDRRHRPILWCSLVAAALTAPVFHRLVDGPYERIRGTNDIIGTLERVRWMELWPLRLPVPHPGWSFAVKVTSPVVGEVWAVTLILAAATGACVAVLMTIGRSMWDDRPRLSWPASAVFGLGYVVMENPALFLPRGGSWWNRYLESGTHARGQGYLPLHQWGTPTITMSMPFVFAMFALLLWVMGDAESDVERSGASRRRWVLAVLTVVTTLVQPATTLAVAPGVVAYLVVTRRVDRRWVRSVGLSFLVPGVVVVLWQTWFLVSDASPWETASWVWRPGWSWSYFGLDRPSYWTTLLFLATCCWAGGRRYVRDPWVALSAVSFATAVVPFLLFEQVGLYEPEGDLGVPALMASILLFVGSLRFGLLELQSLSSAPGDRARDLPLWAPVMCTILLVMVCAGVVDLLAATGVTAET